MQIRQMYEYQKVCQKDINLCAFWRHPLMGSRKLMYNNAVHIGYSNSYIGYFQVVQSKRCKVHRRVMGQWVKHLMKATGFLQTSQYKNVCFKAKFVKIHCFNSTLMYGSCHLDKASNVKIGVECQIFVIVIFFNCGRVLQFGAHSRYYKGASTQKRSFLLSDLIFMSTKKIQTNIQH